MSRPKSSRGRIGLMVLAGAIWMGATSSGVLATSSGPTNDNFANASVLSGVSGSVSADTSGATREAGEPTVVGNAGGHSVWYGWTAPASGSVSVDTHGSVFDTTLAVYTGSSLSGLSKLVENDDTSDTTSKVSFTAVAGVSYWIQVDGYNGTSHPPWYGALKLNWHTP